ncbi:MAG: glycosyltransferase family 4 protein, partial [Pyrinomonadaceae bacterium]
VIFTGWQEEMPMLYAAIDIFVSAARSEPFGLVIAEAMASGTAIVATETVGAGEILENNVTGILTAIENPQAIANAIAKLLEDKKMKEILEKNARKRVKEKFGLERMVAETEKIYSEILAAI